MNKMLITQTELKSTLCLAIAFANNTKTEYMFFECLKAVIQHGKDVTPIIDE